VSTAASRFAPDITAPGRTPSILNAFDGATVPGLTQQPAFFKWDAAVDLDYRDSIPPTRTAVRLDRLPLAGASRGGRYQVTFSSYDDRELNKYSFRTTRIDLQQFVPFLRGHRVLAFRALAVLSDTSNAQAVPFYLSPTYGGLSVGRGYPTFRFRDRNLLALQAEYRYQVSPLVGGALFADAGQVAPSVGAIQWSEFKSTYGIGVRFGAAGGAALRFDLAFGGDRPTFIFGLGHAF
jgi:outer membrane protein assembly factor BamA